MGSNPSEGTKYCRIGKHSLLDPDLIMGDDVSLSERLRCRIANPVRLVQFQQDTPNSANNESKEFGKNSSGNCFVVSLFLIRALFNCFLFVYGREFCSNL